MPLLQTEEIHKRTDMILRNISENFNPALKVFLTAGRAFEKALAGVSVTSKAYFESMSKLGVISCESSSAKDLGESIREIAETFQQIQLDYEETIKYLNDRVFYPLESKHENDTRYMLGLQKKYQSDFKMRTEDLERLNLSHKKLKRKNFQGRKSLKNDDKEKQLLETLAQKRKSLDQFQHDSMKQAFIEERRRCCFFVLQQCEFAKSTASYHRKSMELLNGQIGKWTETCADVKNLPHNATALLDMSKPDDTSSICSIPDPPNEPAIQINGHEYNNTMPNRVHAPYNGRPTVMPEDGSQTLPKSNAVSSNLTNTSGHNVIPRENRKRVNAVFSHTVPGSPTQLSFEKGDTIILMIPQPRDGWHFGENDRTKQRGWFPYSYTKLVEHNSTSVLGPSEPVTGQMPLPPADYNSDSNQKPNGINPTSPEDAGMDPYRTMKDQFLLGNPFANVQLRKTENGNPNMTSSFH